MHKKNLRLYTSMYIYNNKYKIKVLNYLNKKEKIKFLKIKKIN